MPVGAPPRGRLEPWLARPATARATRVDRAAAPLHLLLFGPRQGHEPDLRLLLTVLGVSGHARALKLHSCGSLASDSAMPELRWFRLGRVTNLAVLGPKQDLALLRVQHTGQRPGQC